MDTTTNRIAARERLIALAAEATVNAQDATDPQRAAAYQAAAGQWIVLVALLTDSTPRRPWISPALRAADQHAVAAGMTPVKDELTALLYG